MSRLGLIAFLCLGTSALGSAQTYSWSNSAGGNWIIGTNWTGNSGPNAGTGTATAYINYAPFPVPGMTATTEITSTMALSKLYSGNRVNMIGGSAVLTLNGTGSIINNLLYQQTEAMIQGPGSLSITGGISIIGNGTVNVAGGLTLSGNSLIYNGLRTGPTVHSGVMDMNGALVGLDDGTSTFTAFPFTNTGHIKFNNASSASNTNLTNAAGGVIEKVNNGGFGPARIGSYNGMIPRTTNHGMIVATDGTLILDGQGYHYGTVNTQPAGTIQFAGFQRVYPSAHMNGPNFSMAGGELISDTIATLGGNFAFSGGTLRSGNGFQINNINMTGGTITGPGEYEFMGNSTVREGNFNSGLMKFFDSLSLTGGGGSRMISNDWQFGGSTVRSGGGEISSNGSSWTNFGTFTVTGGGQMLGLNFYNRPGAELVVNNPSFTTGMFVTPNNGFGSFNNDGIVTVQQGHLDLSVGGVHTGAWRNTGASLVRLGAGVHEFNEGSSMADGKFQISTSEMQMNTSLTIPWLQMMGNVGCILRANVDTEIAHFEPALTGTINLVGEAATIFQQPVQIASLNATGNGPIHFNDGANLSGITHNLFKPIVMYGASSVTGQLSGNGSPLEQNGTMSLAANISNVQFANSGTLNLNNPINVVVTPPVGLPMVNVGTINITDGSLEIRRDSEQAGPVITVPGRQLRFSTGMHNVQVGADFTNADLKFHNVAGLLDPNLNIQTPTTIRRLDSDVYSKITANAPVTVTRGNWFGVEVRGPSTVTLANAESLFLTNVASGGRLTCTGPITFLDTNTINGVMDLPNGVTTTINGHQNGSGTINVPFGATYKAAQGFNVTPAVSNSGIVDLDFAGTANAYWPKLHNQNTVKLKNVELETPQSPNWQGTTFTGGVWELRNFSNLKSTTLMQENAATLKFYGGNARSATGTGQNTFQYITQNNGGFEMYEGASISFSNGFTHRGMLRTDASSTITVNGPITMPQGAIWSEGTLNITGGITAPSGQVELSGVANVPDINITGGYFSPGIQGVGSGVINGNLNVTSAGNCVWQLAGSGVGQFDKTTVNGLVNLGGLFHVQLNPLISIPSGQTMPIVTSNQPIGDLPAWSTVGFGVNSIGNTAYLSTLCDVSSNIVVYGGVDLLDSIADLSYRTIKVDFEQNGNPVGTMNGYVDESYQYYVVVPIRGTFDIFAKIPQGLRKRISGVNIGNAGSLVNFEFINGDIDDDNEVGPGDFGILSSSFGSVPGDANWVDYADLDGDWEVGPSDFGILSTNFGLAGD